MTVQDNVKVTNLLLFTKILWKHLRGTSDENY